MSCAVIYVRVSKDRKELEREHAEKKADVLRVPPTQHGDNRDNSFLPKPKDKWFIKHNRLKCFIGPYDTKQKAEASRKREFNLSPDTEVVSMDETDTIRSTLEEEQRYSKRLEKHNFEE
jgi:hypothetical protein